MIPKIIVINRYFFPVRAGIETVLLQLLRHFDPQKYSVTVHVSANTLAEQNVLPLEDKKEHIIIKRYKTIKGFFYPKISYSKINALILTNFTLAPHLFILFSISLRKLLGNKKFMSVYFPNGGFTPVWNSFSPLQRLIKQTIHIVLGRILINYSSDHVIAISAWEKRELIKNKISPSLIRIVPLGLEDEAFLPVTQDQISQKSTDLVRGAAPYIIQIGRIHRVKNIDTTIRALALMENPFTYIIAGGFEDKNYLEELQVLIKEKNLTEKVIFLGEITTEKYYLIDQSICMVHMSHSESFGLAIYEGMSRGKICIVADNSALQEAVKDGINGYRVGTTDEKELARKLSYLQTPEGKQDCKKMEGNNKEEMKKYRWANVATNVQELLK